MASSVDHRAAGIDQRSRSLGLRRHRIRGIGWVLAVCWLVIAARLIQLAMFSEPVPRLASAEPISRTLGRPDIVDRAGRLLARDVTTYTVHADPARLRDPDAAAEQLAGALAIDDRARLRAELVDRSNRYIVLKRHTTPRLAKAVHALGLDGIGFAPEPRRLYPNGRLLGHTLGTVDVDNRGTAGLERWLDKADLTAPAFGSGSTSPQRDLSPVRLTVDLGVAAAVAGELAAGLKLYGARGAAAVVLEANRGEIVASVSLPGRDPAKATDWQDATTVDHVAGVVFTPGSLLAPFTAAMAITAGDQNSSELGAAKSPLQIDADVQRSRLARLGLVHPISHQAGGIAAPLLPPRWGEAEAVTIARGRSIALAPLQVAASGAALINGGWLVPPTLLARDDLSLVQQRERALSEATSATMRASLRANVASPAGSGHAIEAIAGPYRVGGTTGATELTHGGGGDVKAVTTSCLAAFPMERPRWVIMVVLFGPWPISTGAVGTAPVPTAAPLTGRIVARIAPMLGVLPVEAAPPAPVPDPPSP